MDLLWQVARPDNQVLREGDVHPQHYKGKHEVTEVMEMLRRNDIDQRFTMSEVCQRNNHEREGG